MFRLIYGSHTEPRAHAESLHKKRKGAELHRSWWVDVEVPGRDPRDHWAYIRKEED